MSGSFLDRLRGLEPALAQARRDDKDNCASMRVYFIQESGIGAIKIGVSKNAPGRVREMNGNTPHDLVLLATIEGGRCVEGMLHLLFEHARIRGEWFRPVEELLDYIKKEGESPEATKKRELESLFEQRRNMRVIA